MSLGFRCVFARDAKDGTPNHKTFWFEKNAAEGDGKKPYSFHLKHQNETSSDGMKIEKPSYIVIDCAKSDNDSRGHYEFMFGAIEIYSNSRNIEVYAVEDGKDDNGSEYWQTYRGKKIENGSNGDEELYHTIILPPTSKPTALRSLQCKLLSIRPSTCKHAYVQQLMLKGRLPEIADSGISSDGNAAGQYTEPVQSNVISHSAPPNASSEPIAKAVNALTMMIHSVQNKIESSVQSAVGELENTSYNQHQKLIEQISKLGISVSEVKAEVEKLNGNLESMRTELKLQNNREEMNVLSCQFEQMRDQRNSLDKECIQSIIQNEYKTLLTDIKKQNEIFIAQLKDDIAIHFQNNFMNNESLQQEESVENPEPKNEHKG